MADYGDVEGGDAQYGDDFSNKRPYEGADEVSNGNNPPKKARGGGVDGGVEMRLLIPARSAGGIIGKRGANIQDMREQFKAQIQIPDSDTAERVLRVFANIQSCGEIILRVIPCINEERRGDEEFEATIRLLVHQSNAGTIIGMKGFKIKELREKTGAIIKVHQEYCPNSTDRVCQISGKPEVVSECLKLILDLIEKAPPKGPVIKYDPGNCGDGSFGNFGPGPGFGGPGPFNNGGFNMGGFGGPYGFPRGGPGFRGGRGWQGRGMGSRGGGRGGGPRGRGGRGRGRGARNH